MVEQQGADPEALETLARLSAAGDGEARREWLQQLYPELLKLVRGNSSMRPMAASDDHVHNVVQRAVAKLSKGVGTYPAWKLVNPDKALLDWVRILTKNAIRDYARAQLGPRTGTDQPSVKRLLNEFASSEPLDDHGERPPLTAMQTARELFEFAKEHLSAPQLRVLELWLQGQSFDEIATDLRIPGAAAASLLRAGIAVLRRHFRAPGTQS